MKTEFPDDRKGAVEEEEDEEDGEEENCSLHNKMSKLTIVKKEKNKHLKSSTKSNPAERSTTITISFSKKKLQWSACRHCTNVDNITKTWREKVKCEEPINLQEGMYLLMAFTFSKLKVCNRHFLILCKRL